MQGIENSILPEGFDGTFRFTNFTEEPFTTLWNSVEYTFPAMSTVPMIIAGESPENVQSIRKTFARRLAMREFYKGNRYDALNGLTAKTGVPPLVDEEKEFTPFIAKCLEPLPAATATAKRVPKSKTETTEHTKVLQGNESLKAGATDADSTFNGMADE